MRISLCQINSYVGDIKGNTEKIKKFIKTSSDFGADIVVFPELCITGYPPEDLLLNPDFIKSQLSAVSDIKNFTKDFELVCIVGFVDKKDDLLNSAAVISNGEIIDVYHKIRLPNYGVFDEVRYFQFGQAKDIKVYKIEDFLFSVNICEDIWYPGDPTWTQTILGNAALVINISSSPYHLLKPVTRENMLSTRAQDYNCYVAFCNTVGGQDELVFDGTSSVISPYGQTIARAPSFKEYLLLADISADKVFSKRLNDPRRREEQRIGRQIPTVNIDLKRKEKKTFILLHKEDFLEPEEEIFTALVTATHDYVVKNGFSKVIIGLSGGIDSSLVACIAVEALGKDSVICVSMPSMFSSEGSIADSEKLTENLGVRLIKIPITEIYNSFLKSLKNEFEGTSFGLAEENLQARIRGNILMALSNKFGYLVLTTGNKSEMSMGYATLYGDMAGGFAVLKDIYKTMVYKLAEFYNRKMGREIIPRRVFEKPPSAELRPNQKDEDTLPPYHILDKVLEMYIEENLPVEVISRELGNDLEFVKRIVKTVDRNEYKRRQAPPGVKITNKAFGKDRRNPITSKF